MSEEGKKVGRNSIPKSDVFALSKDDDAPAADHVSLNTTASRFSQISRPIDDIHRDLLYYSVGQVSLVTFVPGDLSADGVSTTTAVDSSRRRALYERAIPSTR